LTTVALTLFLSSYYILKICISNICTTIYLWGRLPPRDKEADNGVLLGRQKGANIGRSLSDLDYNLNGAKDIDFITS